MMFPLPVRAAARRAWGWLFFKYMFFAGLCLGVMAVQLYFRVPGDLLVPLLPVLGLALGALNLVLLLNHVLVRMPQEHPLRRVVRWVDRGASIVIVGFVGYGIWLQVNATMIQSSPVTHQSEILSISGGQIDLGVTVPYRWATLRSWDDPSKTFNLLITPREDHDLWGGEVVVVHVRDGLFDKPWVTRIERDKEHYAREVLKQAPTAAKAWRDLINIYIVRQEWDKAVAEGRRYLETYPGDFRFAHNMGTELRGVRYANDAIFFLEHIIAQQPNYEDYQLLGVAYVNAKKPTKAAAVFEASIPLKPRDWEAYHHLGLVYHDLKRYDDAVAQFDRVLEFIPEFPMIEQMRARSVQKLVELSPAPQHAGAPLRAAAK